MKRSMDFPDDLMKRLKKMASKKGITVSALVKLACSEYLEKEEKK